MRPMEPRHACWPARNPESVDDTWDCPTCGIHWVATRARDMSYTATFVVHGIVSSDALGWEGHRG